MSTENQKVVSVDVETGEEKETSLVIPKDFDWQVLETANSTQNVAPKYFEFNTPGVKIRGFYIGLSKIEKAEKEGVKEIPVVLILTKEGVAMNGGVALVDTVKRFCRIGEPVEIEFTGTKKTSNGVMKEYAVRPLQL